MAAKLKTRDFGTKSNPGKAAQRPSSSFWFRLWGTRKSLLASALLLVLVLITFWPAVENDFVGYDDPDYVTANPHIQQGLSWETVRWAFSSTEVAAWHPLAWLSHALDYECFGLQPWGHHLTSILLHAFNSVACFLVLWGFTGAFARSWVAAALFALHPLRVESVAWVSERKDVLSVAFFLLTLWAYGRYAKTSSEAGSKVDAHQTGLLDSSPKSPWSRSTAFLGLGVVFYALGLMSKPMLVTTPFVLLLVDAWPLRRLQKNNFWKLAREKIPFIVAALVVSVITIKAQPHNSVAPGGMALVPRIENAAVSYCRYLGKFFWPSGLAPFYPPVDHWPASVWIGAGILLVLISFGAVKAWRGCPYLLVGWLWFLGTLIPVIGLVQIGEQSVTDRYFYIPSVGILLSLVWSIGEMTKKCRMQTAILSICVSGVLVSCMLLARDQVKVWRTSETLFEHMLAVTRGNYLAHNNLGVVLDQQGSSAEAIDQYEVALKIKPGYPEALKNLGVAFEHLNQLEKAEEFFKAALRQRPDFAAACNGLGLVYQKKGHDQEAIDEFNQALKANRDYADAHFNLALALERQGKLDQAGAELLETLKLQPNSADVYNNLGVLLEKQGRHEQAIQQYVTAVRINPNFARAYFNLGVALTNKGMVKEAMEAFEMALKLNPDYPAARTNLAILQSIPR